MGKFYGGNFQAIKEYFQQKFCRFCNHPFTAEGIELLREEPGILVVKIGCLTCGHPLGVALVGTNSKSSQIRNELPLDWTKRDGKKFCNKPAITYDDVLEAHNFFSNLGNDWSKHLPKADRINSN